MAQRSQQQRQGKRDATAQDQDAPLLYIAQAQVGTHQRPRRLSRAVDEFVEKFNEQQSQGENGRLAQRARFWCRWRGRNLYFDTAILEGNSGTP
ncbi:MAG: hypothetical protein GY832_46090 [Chloroflexi bacterium]|nr:hypothetical protein [Chloroflexota bacterium]